MQKKFERVTDNDQILIKIEQLFTTHLTIATWCHYFLADIQISNL